MSSKTKFESLLEAVSDALVGMDQSGVIRFVNRETESLFGYDRDDLVGQHIEMLVPDSLWHVYLAHRDGYFSDPRSRSMGLDLELRGRHQDGSEFPVDVSLSRVDTGHVLLAFTAVREAADQRRAFDNAQRMMAMIENSEDAIIGNTLGGTITSWNPAATGMYGYTSREIIGKPIGILAPEDRAGEIQAILDNIMAGEAVHHFETVRVRKDGEPLAVSISVSPIRNEQGDIIGASTIARDMTERILAFEAARAMIESSQDSLVSISPEGKITDANQATVRFTGVPREQLIGTDFPNYFTDPDRANEVAQRVFTQGTALDYPLTIRHLDGTLTDVVYNASVHRTAGHDLGVFAAARDVTKLREAFRSARAMIESSLDSLVAINPEGRITDVNEATTKVTGYSRDHLIGTAFSDYFIDPEKANSIYQRVFEEGLAVDYPLTIIHRDGTLADVIYNATAYRDDDGTVRGVFATARDVTKENQAQQRFTQQRAIELERLAELETFHRLTVGRELRMIGLKKEIEYLSQFAPRNETDPTTGDESPPTPF